ncbi:MAG: hypothetical protein AAGD14_06335 [Planctomycetota bacterium]
MREARRILWFLACVVPIACGGGGGGGGLEIVLSRVEVEPNDDPAMPEGLGEIRAGEEMRIGALVATDDVDVYEVLTGNTIEFDVRADMHNEFLEIEVFRDGVLTYGSVGDTRSTQLAEQFTGVPISPTTPGGVLLRIHVRIVDPMRLTAYRLRILAR